MRDVCQETLNVVARTDSLTKDELDQLYPDLIHLFDLLSFSRICDCISVLDNINVKLDQISVRKHQERD